MKCEGRGSAARPCTPADIDSAWGAIRDAEQPRIHPSSPRQTYTSAHQLRTSREDVKERLRRSSPSWPVLLRRTSSSRRWTRRARTRIHRRDARHSDRGGGDRPSTSRTPSATPGAREFGELTSDDLRAWCRGSRRPSSRSTATTTSGMAVAQRLRRRSERRAAGRVHHQRHRRAGRQLLAGGGRDGPDRPEGRPRRGRPASTASELVQDQPAWSAPHRHPCPAQQGDRRRQRLRPRVRHPPGRRAEGAHHLRDHGPRPSRPGDSNSLVLGKHSGRHALRDALEQLGFKIDGNALNAAFKRFKADGRPQEARHRARPGGARLRRDATSAPTPTSWPGSRSSAGSRREPLARRRVKMPSGEEAIGGGERRRPGQTRSSTRSRRRTGTECELRQYTVEAVTGGRGRARPGDGDAARPGACNRPGRERPTSSRPRPRLRARSPTPWRAPASARPRRPTGPRPPSSASPGPDKEMVREKTMFDESGATPRGLRRPALHRPATGPRGDQRPGVRGLRLAGRRCAGPSGRWPRSTTTSPPPIAACRSLDPISQQQIDTLRAATAGSSASALRIGDREPGHRPRDRAGAGPTPSRA